MFGSSEELANPAADAGASDSVAKFATDDDSESGVIEVVSYDVDHEVRVARTTSLLKHASKVATTPQSFTATKSLIGWGGYCIHARASESIATLKAVATRRGGIIREFCR